METLGFVSSGELMLIFLIAISGLIFLGLALIALLDVLRNEFTGNNKLIWVLVILFLQPIGAILYFIIGRQNKIKPL